MSKWFSSKLIERGIIEREEEGLYQFGIQNGFIILLNVFTAFLIGLFTDKLLLVTVFTVSFMTLRSYTGGYHCDNKVICYISSSLVLFIPIYTSYMMEIVPGYALFMILVVSVLIIAVLSPMNSKKRKLDSTEKKHFGKRARVLLVLQLVILLILYGVANRELVYAVYSSIYLIALFMLIGKVSLQIQLHMDE